VRQFRGRLVVKAHGPMYYSTASRVIKKKKKKELNA